MLLLSMFILALIFISGCTSASTVGGGLFIDIRPDKPQVFASDNVVINIDIDNKNTRRVTDVKVDIFDAGLMSFDNILQYDPIYSFTGDDIDGTCGKFIDFMLPDQFKTVSCVYRAPGRNILLEDATQTQVNARIKYTTELSLIQIIEMMEKEEYELRSQSGKLKKSPAKYSYRDKNVEIGVDFSDELPIAIVPGREYFAYFTIKNIGNGVIDDIKYGDFNVRPVSGSTANIIDCGDIGKATWNLKLSEGKFPRIACRLYLPSGVRVIENYGLQIDLRYNYEVRGNTEIRILK